ncbi:DUF1501 domain-containing protein [Runella sp.]|uniref:DUF1501 domain-containing protein n=1 Tax=Runella sp. TaxID=1960881 RepID=UPI003D0B5154
MNRRNFIKQAGCAAMGSTTLLSTLTQLTSLNGALGKQPGGAGYPTDYKALVCILLSGGVDSYNMLIPMGVSASGDNGFNEYKAIRTALSVLNPIALSNPQCVGFRDFTCNYGAFGVHPQMSGVRDLFNSGKLSFISNVGTLVEPLLNKTQFNSGLKKVPVGLYSHSDQMMQWQTSVPQSRNALGFGGRVADLLNAANSNTKVSMNISLAGKNTFQRGQDISEYAISNNVQPGSVGFEALPSWWSNTGYMTDLRNSTMDSLVSQTYASLLQESYSSGTKTATAAFEVFKAALTKVSPITTAFPADKLATDLLAIAKIISVRSQLGAKRQIFFVNYGGWDMHDDLLTGLDSKLPVVSQALKAFYDATVELGVADKVTTFTISDFARTITSNGNGSDHGWGGNQIVMGGGVNGGKIMGAYPKMDANNPLNISLRGNFIPAVSTDEFYAELALWYGISPSDLCYVLPNIGNFYSYSPGRYPIGFMNFNGTAISTENYPQNCLTY